MNEEGLSPIVKIIAAMLFPFILIYSLYIIMHGHLTPGGGFQGGAIGASAVVLLVVAFGPAMCSERPVRIVSRCLKASVGWSL